MTCIIAWKEEDKICIGGDSAGVRPPYHFIEI